MATYNNIKDLKEAILSRAKQGVNNVVMPEVKEAMADAIQKFVYDKYEPKRYVRRYERGVSGGLNDVDNVVEGWVSGEYDNGFDFEIWNLALPDESDSDDEYAPTYYLAPLIIMGQEEAKSVGYPVLYKGTGAYNEPRDFITPTVKKMKSNKNIGNKLKKYMK